MNLEDLEDSIIDAISRAVILSENHRDNEAHKAALEAKMLISELCDELWHRYHRSGVGPS